MAIKLKTKLGLGLSFLFIVILTYGILAIFYINRLSGDAEKVLKNNYESLVYCNNMLKSLEDIPGKKEAIQLFDNNLSKQENNITEIGEREATQTLRRNFSALLSNPGGPVDYATVRQDILRIDELNQQAMLRKNAVALKTAEDATLWLTIIFVVLGLVAFSFVVNFPAIIATPVRLLNDGIHEIANKNYRKRIFLQQEDEFGELAAAFNSMAEKLDEYEHSNLAQIKFEKSRIETIINQMKDGIIGLDAKRNILILNPVAETLLGIKESSIIGMYAPDVALGNDLMRTLLHEDKKELKIFADNKESYFNKDTLNVTNNETIIGQVIILRNITPFHELNTAKTNFIATVSHELKTPISAIKMSAQLLTDNRVGSLNNEQQELIGSIRDDAERLLKITGELLNMSQVETGHIHLKLQATNPASIIEQATQAVALPAQQKNIAIHRQLANDLPSIQADAEKTSWVLVNLLTNAIKYSSESSSIEVSASLHKGKIIFTVTDHGKGIDEKYLPRIFDRYFKVPGVHEETGTGLGLSISKEFIEAQHGQIWAASRTGEGSQFSFSLPKA